MCPVACVARGCQTLTHPSRKNGGAAEWVKQGHRWAVIQKRQRRVLRTSQGRRERAPECELGDPVSRPVTLDKSLQLSEHFSSYVKERLRTTRTKACALAPSQERVKSTHTGKYRFPSLGLCFLPLSHNTFVVLGLPCFSLCACAGSWG